MKMKNEEAFNALQTIASTKETGRLGYALAKTRRKMETELAEYINIRNGIIQKHAVVEGGEMRITAPAAAEANKELAEYAGLLCEFEPCRVDEETFTGGGLTSADMYVLDFMVEVPHGE